MKNLILNTDSYKLSHFLQYPEGTRRTFSYIEARENSLYDEIVFFGLQAFIKEYIEGQVVRDTDILKASSMARDHGLPFNIEGWKKVVFRHKGRLPVKICAPDEGTVVPKGNVLLTIENTDPELFWLPSYLETALLRAIWYPSTVATISHHVRKVIKGYMEKTCDNLDGLPFKLHDFGARGATSQEAAMLGGMGHLLSFLGTDNVPALVGAKEFYKCNCAGFSIPAAEHSTIISWGKENEEKAYANMVQKFGGEGKMFAVVSDSYHIQNAVNNIWGGTLRDMVKFNGGTLVIRPDSGDPVLMAKEVIRSAMCKFGHTKNSKGYEVLNPCVRVIQGDGNNPYVIDKTLSALEEEGISAENIAFGMGAKLLQGCDRDTCSFAMKMSAIEIGGSWEDNKIGGWREVKKTPAGQPEKASKGGRLQLAQIRDQIKTLPDNICLHDAYPVKNLLDVVFENGELRKERSFEDIRAKLAKWQ